MPKSHLLFCLALAGFVAAGGGGVRAEFVANLSVDVSVGADGYYLYEYTLTNAPTSTLPAVQFDLAVGEDADLQDILAAAGWDVDYVAGSPGVSFFTEDPDSVIAPGSSGVFSFRSRLAPAAQEFYLVGVDPPAFEVLDGTVESPAVTPSAVPEPSGLALLAASATVAGICGIRRRGSCPDR